MRQLMRRGVRHAQWRRVRREGGNVAYNKRFWDVYAKSWSDVRFRDHVASDLGGSGGELAVLGEEWGRGDVVEVVLGEWILPHLGPGSAVGEIGPGGGRWASRVAPQVGRYYGFDVSKEMVKLLGRTLAGQDNAELFVLDSPALPERLEASLDFVFSYDVFVHLDLHTQWAYVREISRVLKPGGHVFLHTANLTTEAGWKQFSSQTAYAPENFYFMTPQAVQTMLSHAGLDLVRDSAPRGAEGITAENKDYMFIARKPE